MYALENTAIGYDYKTTGCEGNLHASMAKTIVCLVTMLTKFKKNEWTGNGDTIFAYILTKYGGN